MADILAAIFHKVIQELIRKFRLHEHQWARRPVEHGYFYSQQGKDRDLYWMQPRPRQQRLTSVASRAC